MIRAVRIFLLVLSCAFEGQTGSAQEKAEMPDLKALAAGPGRRASGNAYIEWVEDAKGRAAIKVQSKKDDALILLHGIEFSNGVIEFDALGQSGSPQSNFLGIAFRIANADTHDVVYFRPFNFRVEDPDRQAHAVQYVSHPQFQW